MEEYYVVQNWSNILDSWNDFVKKDTKEDAVSSADRYKSVDKQTKYRVVYRIEEVIAE